MTFQPWKLGPRELLDHAKRHISKGGAFDYRIAMISIDNAVELGIKTYLGLPKRVRGTDGPARKELESTNSFPDYLDMLEEYAEDKLHGTDLGDIEVYHRLRNTLYHDGNGVTVDPVHVDAYFQIAEVLLNNLLDIGESKDTVKPVEHEPLTTIGELIRSWGKLEQKVRFQAQRHVKKDQTLKASLPRVVDALIAKGILTGDFSSRLRKIYNTRNSIVHGIAVPPEPEVRRLVEEIEGLINEVPNAGC